MKKLGLLLLFLNAFMSIAQESQEVTISKWKDGQYDAYFTMMGWNKSDDRYTVTIKKTKNNKVAKIIVKNSTFTTTYVHADSSFTPFVRHYTSDQYSDSKMYINDSLIIMYRIEGYYPDPKIVLNNCIGKKPGFEAKEEILAYLAKTKDYYVPTSVSRGKDIESITPVIITDNVELSTGGYIELGLIIKLKWGIVLKTKNIGGTINVKDFSISSNQLKEYTEGKKSVWKVDCSKTVNKEMEIVVWVNYDSDNKFKTLLPVKCDSENSPVALLTKAFNEYDEIHYLAGDPGKKESKVLKKLPETGYSTYAEDLIEISKIKDVETNLIRLKLNDKIGYADKNGKIIIPVQYDGGLLNNFTNGLIGVKKDGKCGYINFANKTVIPFDYDMVWYFKGTIAKIKNAGKFGFVNQQGKLISNAIYDEVWDLHSGMVVVKKDGKYGYISETGAIIANTIYDDAFDFNLEDFGTVQLNNKQGCIDKTGKIVVPIEYEKSPKSLNSTLFKVYKNGKYGIIKKDGKMLFDFVYDEIYNCGTRYTGSNAESDKYIRVKKDGKYGFVTTDGKIYKDCIYNTADDFYGGMAAITKTDNGVEKKGTLVLNMSDGKGNVYKGGYEDLHEIEQEKSEDNTSSYSSSGSRGGSKSGSDKKTIKNTGKNTLYFGADGNTGYRINGGSSQDIPCGKKVYYTFWQNGGYNGEGPVISAAKQDCGKTINANGDQYHRK